MKNIKHLKSNKNLLFGLFSKLVCIVLFCLLSTLTSAQISGVIIDDFTGDPLIGVNIIVKGKTVGAVTNIDGQFNINAQPTDTLIISYIGYADYKVLAKDIQNQNIKLTESTAVLDQVVVVGYGAVGKKDLTGVVAKIPEKEFNQGSLTSPDKLLNGKVAGLQISNNGEPGGDTRIRLRGGTSLDASSDPLIVVDGVPIDNKGTASTRNILNFINATDVESMTVLKDASAAAIYGSRGANGVIIITTKTGSRGKLNVNYRANANVSIFNGRTNFLSESNFRNAISAKAPQEIEFLGDNQTDWVKEVTQNAIGMEHNLSLNGAGEKYDYLFSGGYLNSNGVLKTSKHEKINVGANLGTKLFNKNLIVKIKSKTNLSDDVFAPNVMGSALSFDPTRPILDAENEEYGGYYQWDDPLANNNPVSTLNLWEETGRTLRTLNNLKLELKIPFIEGLSFHSNTAYDFADGEKRIYKDPFLKDGNTADRGGYLFNEELQNVSQLIETYGTYKRDLKGINSKIEFTAGHSWQDTKRENRWEDGNQLQTIEGEITYTEDVKVDSFKVQNRLISFFGRTNFTVAEKYLLTASLRRDGSSRFGAANKWGLFPAAAIGWRVLEEDFASGLKNTFSNLKLRLSWGITGNEDIEDYLFTTFYNFGTNDAAYQFGSEFVNTLRGTGVDPDIKWEETTSINFGVDFGFWNDRLTGGIDLYQKNTNDLIFNVATSAFTNLSDRILTNIGEMENKGIELALNGVLYDRANFDWTIGFNTAFNKNEIVKLDNSNLPEFLGYETGGISGDIGQTIQVLKVGESVESFRTYNHMLGSDGLPLADTEDWNLDGIVSDLDIYEDVNGDGLINENDLVINENAAPDVIFGLTSNVTLNNWDLSATLRSHIGNYVYNNVASGNGYFDRLTDRVTNNIDATAFELNIKDRQLKSNYYIENASFLKLDNITLGYNVQTEKLFKTLRFYTTATNIFTLTGYSGLDPETPQFHGGIDNNIYPTSLNILFGLNASF